MFILKLGKPKDDLKFFFRFSGECLGRQIVFGISQDELAQWGARGRKIVSDVRQWKERVRSARNNRGMVREVEAKKVRKNRAHESQPSA